MAIIGLREFQSALRKVERDANAAARLAVVKTSAIAEAAMKAGFSGSHKKGEPHVGGSRPNVVSGTARRSIRTDPIRAYGIGDFGTIVAPHVVYGRRLELGYPGGGTGRGHQASRAFPYFEPGVKKARDAFPAVAAEQWRRFLLA